MAVCRTCVLSDHVPFADFDERGVCAYCRQHHSASYRGEGDLRRELATYRRRNGKPDCLVPVSGGRDSTFVLLSMVRDYGMHPLAVHYANPFSDPQALSNVREACRVLDVPLVVLSKGAATHRRVFRHNLRTWLRRPSAALSPMMCLYCRTLWWGVVKTARKHHLRMIVSGNNRFEDTGFKKALLGVSPRETWESTYRKSLPGVIRGVLGNLRYLHPLYAGTFLKAWLFGDTYAPGMRWFASRLRILDLFYYRPWHETEVLERIRSEVNWRIPADAPSTWRWDCDVAFLKDLIYTNLVGATEKDDFYAKMVREGEMDRETALERLKQEKRIPMERICNALAVAGIGLDEFMLSLEKASRVRHHHHFFRHRPPRITDAA